ncbi:MAG: hypothetical protein ABI076_02550 [Acidobacteriaceae bacterium]
MASNRMPAALPNAPQPATAIPAAPREPQDQDDTQQIPTLHPANPAPRLAKYIEPEQQALSLSAKDKLELSAWEQVQPYAISTEILAAAWEHLLNGNPKYGSDKAGFGERIGAAAIRQTSQAIFADGVVPALLHQDPRYYRKGTGKILNRVLYSATRVLIIRTDAGHEAPNYSQIIGYAGASALTMTYYPAISATWHETAEGYGISMMTSALGNQLHEFGPDILKLVLHRHPGNAPR